MAGNSGGKIEAKLGFNTSYGIENSLSIPLTSPRSVQLCMFIHFD